jgi:hypothetical protein
MLYTILNEFTLQCCLTWGNSLTQKVKASSPDPVDKTEKPGHVILSMCISFLEIMN